MEKTIAACATPMQQSGIGIIRLCGDNAIAIGERVFRSANENRRLSGLRGYTAAYGTVFDENGDFDDCVVLVFKAPNSYTGEQTVEFSCHGGKAVMLRLLRALYAAGAVPAEPGEFTKLAFLNGKLSLTQAEAVMDVISASGALALKNANDVKNGGLYKKITEIKEKLVHANAGLCVYIDFPEEGEVDEDISEPKALLLKARSELQSLIDNYRSYAAVRDGIDCVIAGKPNVGKSTLMNLLSDFERSIVTDIAGTTRDVVEQTVEMDGLTLRLSDTAGLRETADGVEKLGVQIARKRIENASLVLAVFDCTFPPDDEDKELIKSIGQTPYIVVANKTDLRSGYEKDYSSLGDTVFISAKNGEGRQELCSMIMQKCGVHSSGDTLSLANERQKAAAAAAKDFINDAIEAINAGVTLDAVTVLVDSAIEKLCELSGENVSESVVGEIFSSFCVGK